MSDSPDARPDIFEETEERPSITDAGGTVARFDMSYSLALGEKFVFGPPRSQRWPSLFYLALAGGLFLVAMYGHFGTTTGALHTWMVEGDRDRPMGSLSLAGLILLSGIATVIRAQLRGVIVHGDGVEARYLSWFGVPRVRKWTWPQVHRFVIADSQILLELWDGAAAELPAVAKPREMGDLLERIANMRNILVTRLTQAPWKRGSARI